MPKVPRTYSPVPIREALLIGGPALLVTALAFWFAFQFVQPAPPSIVTISAGNKDGAYYALAEAYAARLARSGVTVKILQSSGSVENLKRLRQAGGEVDIALLQGGVANKNETAGLLSLGRMFSEPLWVFYTPKGVLERLADLKGKRVAIGRDGSGTRKLAMALLSVSGINEESSILEPIGGQEAADALLAGEVDAIFLTSAPQAPLIRKLLSDERSALMSFTQGEAYTRIFPYLNRVTLPKGVFDLVNNIPKTDVTLVAPKAALVARDTLHPAIVGLFVNAAKEIHGDGGMFRRIGEFPEESDPEFKLSEDAKRFYQRGEPWLQSFLPFWLAIFLERMFIMLVPIATILIPLVKILPLVYNWRLKSRMMYWYAQLKAIERDLQDPRDKQELSQYLSDIEGIDRSISAVPMPLHYSDRFYELRAAVDLVRKRISHLYKVAPGKSVAD